MIHVIHLEKLKVASFFFFFVALFCAASSGISPTVIEGCLYMHQASQHADREE